MGGARGLSVNLLRLWHGQQITTENVFPREVTPTTDEHGKARKHGICWKTISTIRETIKTMHGIIDFNCLISSYLTFVRRHWLPLPLFYNVLRNGLMNLSHFVRTDWFYRTIYWFCFVVPAQLYQSATRLEPNTATRLKLWAIGYWLLVIGYWLCDMGGKAAYPCLYTLPPTLYTKSDSDHASTPYALHY